MLFEIIGSIGLTYALARQLRMDAELALVTQKPIFELKIVGAKHLYTYYPKYATKGSACVDLIADIEAPITLKPGEQIKIGTGIAIHIKDSRYVGLIAPRSGKGTEGLVVSNTIGLCDSDYQGEYMLTLLNRNKRGDILISPMDKVAQLGFFKVQQVDFQLVTEFTETTARGTNGFGSTGV